MNGCAIVLKGDTLWVKQKPAATVRRSTMTFWNMCRNTSCRKIKDRVWPKLFKIFGDNTRCSIMEAFNCHEMCVCDLAFLDMTKSAISHQLKILRDNNLVKFEKKGKHAYYSLADGHVREILDVALEHINE